MCRASAVALQALNNAALRSRLSVSFSKKQTVDYDGVLTQRRTDGILCTLEITQEQDALIAPSLPGHRGKVGASK